MTGGVSVVNRRQFVQIAGTALSAAALQAMGCSSKTVRPNFLFILVDDLGWTELGSYGSRLAETPNLDRLAASGVRFTDAYASCPVCSPTRASIMTGKYPARLNITDWIPGNDARDKKLLGTVDRHELSLEEKTIAETLRENGYKTFFAGKWHLGSEGFFPEDQGFDINLGGHHRGSPPGGYYSPYSNPKLDDGPEGEYLPDRLADETIRFMENSAGEPFLAFLSFYTVHTPIQASRRHIDKYETKVAGVEPDGSEYIQEHDGETKQFQDNPAFASMVEAMDENVGRLMDKLAELDLDKDTVIIFTSDNGGLSTLFPGRKAPTSNLPLRAGKGWCYEGGIRVPLIIKVPGISGAARESAVPVISTDFYPTILELAGLPPLPDQHIDGLSLAPFLREGGEPGREAIFWHYPHYHGSAWTPGAAVRAGEWKLIEFYEKEKVELYNLKEDIEEKNDLSDKNPDKTGELLNMLHKWQESTGALMPEPNPDYHPEDES